MRFLIDECAGLALARWLAAEGHDVVAVVEQDRGETDDSILVRALSERRIIVTTDKDFGDMVYLEHRRHAGVILLRLADERTPNKIGALRRLLAVHSTEIEDSFIVVTDSRLRFAASDAEGHIE